MFVLLMTVVVMGNYEIFICLLNGRINFTKIWNVFRNKFIYLINLCFSEEEIDIYGENEDKSITSDESNTEEILEDFIIKNKSSISFKKISETFI